MIKEFEKEIKKNYKHYERFGGGPTSAFRQNDIYITDWLQRSLIDQNQYDVLNAYNKQLYRERFATK